MSDLPFSQSCENNKEPILKVLKQIITKDNKRLLEVGTGTAQHAVFFSKHFTDLHWVTSDKLENHAGIAARLLTEKLGNVHGPVAFEVGKDAFSKQHFDLSFTANTFHIMPWKVGKTLIKHWGNHLREGSQVIIYGPFKYENEFTSESNRIFDETLKSRDKKMGIRNFEDIKSGMERVGFRLAKDYEMPANNRILLFTKLQYISK